MKKRVGIILSLVLILLLTGCQSRNDDPSGTSIILATTTSTENSGLLDYILPEFEKTTDVTVKVVAVGTGKALEMGRNGEADVLLVHAKSSEEQFVADGHGTERFDVMYNDFVIIGPDTDSPLEKGNDVSSAFSFISQSGLEFFSRGDDSGTHKKEISLWKAADIDPSGEWYISVGKGMGDTIVMTNERLGYTMTDRATFLSMKDNIDLTVIIEGDPILFNQYGVIPVNPEKNDLINIAGAKVFVDWLISEEGQNLIGSYEKFGEILFNPNAE